MSIPRNLSILADSASSTGVLSVAGGGTGLSTTPTNGQLDIGNGTGFTRAAITAGTGISVTNGAGSITIAASGGSSPVQASPITLAASSNLTMALGASAPGALYYQSRIITLDANRELVLISHYTSTYSIYAFVYNSSTNTFGAVSTIRATAACLGAILIATDKVLVTSVGSSGTSLEAVVLSISTNTITANTAATATLGGVLTALNGNNYYGSLVTVGTSYVLSYGRATNVSAIVALTVSGTTVTIGSESVLTPATTNAAALYPISSSVVLALSSSATVFYATPYTVSGTTLTVGTGATTTVSNITYLPMGVFQSGQIGVLFQNSTIFGGVISVTGTIATISSAQICSSTTSLNFTNNYAAIINNQMLCYFATAANANLVNVLTNTSGIASAGTEIPGNSSGGNALSYINGIIFSYSSEMVLKYSISGNNAIETIGDTYFAATSNINTRVWLGTALNSYQTLRSTTKTLSLPQTVGILTYANSDGTIAATINKIFGTNTGTSWVGPGDGASGWSIIWRNATTVTATKVTLS